MKQLLDKLSDMLPGSMPRKSKRQTVLLLIIMCALLAADLVIKAQSRLPEAGQLKSGNIQDSSGRARWQALNDAYLISLGSADNNNDDDRQPRRGHSSERYNGGNHSAERHNKPADRQNWKTERNWPSADKQNASAETQYFEFDPNSATEDNLVALGLSRENAKSFVEYRQKGKKFYVPADITDSWAISQNTYARLQKYIRINTDSLTRNGEIRDLNTIDKQGLMECGLSEDEAGKVLDFREKIGWYYAPWQIGDCLGHKRGNKLKNRFYVCRSVERATIDLASATMEEISASPYISEEQARMIIELRSAESPTKASLAKAGIFSNDEMKKVANYIK